MNNDLISREATLEHIKGVFCKGCDNYDGIRCRACEIDDVMSVIDDDVPTVDAEPVRHAAWTYKDDDVCYWWECSACGGDETMNTAFCPNCGAKMDGGEE